MGACQDPGRAFVQRYCRGHIWKLCSATSWARGSPQGAWDRGQVPNMTHHQELRQSPDCLHHALEWAWNLIRTFMSSLVSDIHQHRETRHISRLLRNNHLQCQNTPTYAMSPQCLFWEIVTGQGFKEFPPRKQCDLKSTLDGFLIYIAEKNLKTCQKQDTRTDLLKNYKYIHTPKAGWSCPSPLKDERDIQGWTIGLRTGSQASFCGNHIPF